MAPKAPPIVFLVLIKCSPLPSLLQKITTNLTNPDFYFCFHSIDNMYEFASSHCTDFKDLRDDEDIVINREWILNKLTEDEN